MAAVNRHAYRRGRDAQAVILEDLSRLVTIFIPLRVEVVIEDIDLRMRLKVDLIMLRELCARQDIGLRLAAGNDILDLLLKLGHGFLAAARNSLIRRNDDALDLREIVKRLQGHHHDDRRAVRVGDDALVTGNGLRIDFRNNERDFRIHAESAGIVDDNGTGLDGCRSELLAGCTAGKQGNLDILEGVIRRLLYRVLFAHELDLLASAALGSEHFQIGKGEIALFDEVQEFLAYGTGRAEDRYVVLLHGNRSFLHTFRKTSRMSSFFYDDSRTGKGMAQSSSLSRPTVRPLRPRTFLAASTTPGMKDSRFIES